MLKNENSDIIPCGKRVIYDDGKVFVLLSEGDDVLGIRKVISIEQFCGACRKLKSLNEQLQTLTEEKEIMEVKNIIVTLKTLLGEDHQGPLQNCSIQLRSLSVESFNITKTIDDYDDIQIVSEMIQKYGFPSVMLFMSFYANMSKLGLEWMELLFKETTLQAARLKSTPDLNKDNPLYDKIMGAIHITDSNLIPMIETREEDEKGEKSIDDRMYC